MLDKERGLYVAHSENGPLSLVGKMVNRHGLIAGATGTGKTVTLQVLAETFCQAGVPCFMADMKGDLSGISQVGKLSGFIEKRLPEFGIENPQFQSCPVRLFDVYGEQGHPMRSTISRMGPEMLGRLMDLNETQTGVLNIVFKIADDNGLLLIDLKDLRAMLNFVGQNAAEYTTQYGYVTSASIGAIQRALLALENQGAEKFFGEPDFDIYDLLQCEGGKGIMNVLAADRLMLQPKLYSTFLLWLLSELYATLPEVGEMDLPKLVFFFDEAHMLFEGTSKALTDKIEQVIRLIRSKGVGIYFITQSPTDIPDSVLGQLGNRIQHALRAYTPKDQKAVKVAADTFRANPAFDTYNTLLELETGEALVSLLDEKGAPSIVERAKILFPLSQIGAITEEQRRELILKSRLYGRYDHPVDRESAYELITAATLEAEKQKAEIERQEAEEKQRALEAKEAEKAAKQAEKEAKDAAREAARKAKEAEKEAKEKAKKSKNSIASKVLKSIITAVTGVAGAAVANKVTGTKTKSKTSTTKKAVNRATKSATTTLTRELTRSILGNLIK
jgi:DNA helicase HerA-like ATPase